MQSTEIYRPKTIVSKYYTILFTLPRWQYLAATFIALGIALVVFMREASHPLLVNSFLVYLVLEVYARFYKKSVFYKVKRRVGLALAVLVYSAVFAAITRNNLVSLISSTTLITVVVLGLDGTSVPKCLLVLTPITGALLTSRLLGYYGASELLIGLFTAFALVLVDLAAYTFMSRRKVNNHALPDLGTLFLRNWLDRRTEIELVFEELGEYQYVNSHIIELGDLAVIYTDVHYGPFSNVGSSKLPELLSETFKKLRFKDVIVLHGLGSHDRNIVSSRYVGEYVEYLTKVYLSDEKTKLLYHGAFSVEDDEWRVLGLVFDKLSLLVVSRPCKGIDDLPYTIQLNYEIKAKRLGLGDIIILDAHNWELQDEPNLDKLSTLLDKSLEEVAKMKSRAPVEVYYKYRCFEAPALGVVNKEACMLCIMSKDREEVCLLYLRGNNMKPGVRDILLGEMSNLEVGLVEAITNDEHSETGTRAHIVYVPVHESPELVRAVKQVSEELKGTPLQGSAWLYTCRMNLKLMGESIYEIKRQLGSSVKETATILLSYVFLTPLILSLVFSCL